MTSAGRQVLSDLLGMLLVLCYKGFSLQYRHFGVIRMQIPNREKSFPNSRMYLLYYNPNLTSDLQYGNQSRAEFSFKVANNSTC